MLAMCHTFVYTHPMKTVVAGFDWDDGNWPKCARHGVSREDIERCFENTVAVMPDPCPTEPRMRAIGKTRAGRWVFLVFIMHKKEVEHYEATRTQRNAFPRQ
jgi:uncharacterized DUF497 family protein